MDEAERCTDIGYLYQSKLIACGRPEELKALPEVTPAGTRRWELELPTPATHLSRLRQTEGVLDATLFGQTIHILADQVLSGSDLLAHLDAPPEASHARPIEPTLEDVFVTLSRAAEAAGSSEQGAGSKKEEGAWSMEHGAGSREHRARKKKHEPILPTPRFPLPALPASCGDLALY
jgi:ribosome-dependent ATPase